MEERTWVASDDGRALILVLRVGLRKIDQRSQHLRLAHLLLELDHLGLQLGHFRFQIGIPLAQERPYHEARLKIPARR